MSGRQDADVGMHKLGVKLLQFFLSFQLSTLYVGREKFQLRNAEVGSGIVKRYDSVPTSKSRLYGMWNAE